MITNKHRLGEIGELLVAHLENAVASDNRYDTIKDLTEENGTQIEVKTQNRHPGMNVFSIGADKQTNRDKCMNVDRLIFVEYNATSKIQVWECGPRQNFVRYRTNSMKNMIGWPISEMTLLHEIDEPELANKMRSLSQSEQFRK
jgi:hypothetical protein